MAVASTAPPSSAREASPVFAATLGAADLGAAVACFARDGAFITPGATTIRGHDHIRAILSQLIEMRPSVEVEQRGVLLAADVAIATEIWKIRLNGLDLTPFAGTSESTTVIRRVEGIWKLQIAAPWGWG